MESEAVVERVGDVGGKRVGGAGVKYLLCYYLDDLRSYIPRNLMQTLYVPLKARRACPLPEGLDNVYCTAGKLSRGL